MKNKFDKYFGDAIGLVLILAVIAVAFFLNTFRWGYCP